MDLREHAFVLPAEELRPTERFREIVNILARGLVTALQAEETADVAGTELDAGARESVTADHKLTNPEEKL